MTSVGRKPRWLTASSFLRAGNQGEVSSGRQHIGFERNLDAGDARYAAYRRRDLGGAGSAQEQSANPSDVGTSP